MPDLVTESFMAYLENTEQAQQDLYRSYREYYDGEHATQLTARMRRYLQIKTGVEFNTNYCPIVVDALSERLKVTGFDAGEQGEILGEWWRTNRMDGVQGIVHTAAARDGDAYVLVEWDNLLKRPRFNFEMACTDGVGVKLHYNPERQREVLFASKRWRIEHGAEAGKYRRLNLYFPNKVEKYFSRSGSYEGRWQSYMDQGAVEMQGVLGKAWVHWWTVDGTKDGEPLGVPVSHFINRDQGYDRGQSELRSVVPLQNALNKTIIDLLATADTAAFRILFAKGAGWGDTNVFPGAVLIGKNPGDDLTAIAGEDLRPLIALKDSFVIEIARVTRTPLSAFQVTGQVAAEGTLKQQDSGLVARAQKAQTDFGNSWENVLAIARRLNNAFGSEKMDEEQGISTLWAEAQTRNELERLQVLQIKAELGVPTEQLWREMGYDEEQISKFRRDQRRTQALAIKEMVKAGQNGKPVEEPESGTAEPA